jgi:hypothetical protein
MFEKDLATMYADPLLNESASIGAKSTTGAFDWEDVLEEDGSGFAPVRRRTFTFEIGSTAGRAFQVVAVFDATVVIGGTSYRARDVRHVGAHQLKVILA